MKALGPKKIELFEKFFYEKKELRRADFHTCYTRLFLSGHQDRMTDENMDIEKHITDRFNVQQVLGKGVCQKNHSW